MKSHPFSLLTALKLGEKISKDIHWKEDHSIGEAASLKKSPTRTEVINYLIKGRPNSRYLEIGVRNPADNFKDIKATTKYSVDPGVEFKDNPVDFAMTSDAFFELIDESPSTIGNELFDLIFIDGLHKAPQAYKDILNAIRWIKEDGYIVLHDCNPPTEWHQRANFNFKLTPAGVRWNGTTWKAFVRARTIEGFHSACIDSDWGIGVIWKSDEPTVTTLPTDDFFEYDTLHANRHALLRLVSFDEFQKII